MKNITRNIPNAITCLNIASGVLAILFTSAVIPTPKPFTSVEWGYIFIAIAAVADFMDGFAARLLHQYSDFGKELDSLCDGVSFGVAPGVIVCVSLLNAGTPVWAALFSMIIPVAGVLRLARFNIDTRQTTNFVGLPIPANALFWIGFTSMLNSGFTLLASPFVAVPVIILESLLMLSSLPMFSLKFKTWGWRGNSSRWLLIICAVALIAFCGLPGLMWLIILYLVLSVLSATGRK